MRTRLWNNLSNIKFKALYTYEWSRKATFFGNVYSLFLALTSSGCVAAWAFWQDNPNVWASIVAFAQVLHIAKPYIPLVRNDKSFLEMSFGFEALYLQYEKLFYELDSERITEEEVEKAFYALREKENEIEKTHKDAHCPKWRWLMNRVQEDTYTALSLNLLTQHCPSTLNQRITPMSSDKRSPSSTPKSPSTQSGTTSIKTSVPNIPKPPPPPPKPPKKK